MSRILDAFGRVVTRVPVLTLVVLAVLTGLLGVATATLEVDSGLDGFAPDDGAAAALSAVESRFTTTDSVQVLIDDGAGGNVLERRTIEDVLELGERLESHPDIAPVLAGGSGPEGGVITFALPVDLAAGDDGVADLDDIVFDQILDAIISQGGQEVGGLFSDDLTEDGPRARSGLVIVAFDASAAGEDRRAASRAVEDVVADTPVADTRSAVLSFTAIEDGIDDSIARDLPVLLSVSMVLVIGLLAWIYRSATDISVLLIGLVASIVWMTGLAALLGPGGLGILGPFNQISIAVPVLLVGLGVDYSVHLTTRYREERAAGAESTLASRVALRTVGVALVLATAASVMGFLANVVTPIPPIRDFGIFAAMGIVTAFVVLGAAVPAARTIADRRGKPPSRNVRQVGPTPAATKGAPRRSWVAPLIAVATRAPVAIVIATLLALTAGGVAATGLSTEFDESDFLPEGTPVLATLDRFEAQYGGDVAERTYVLVEGDPRDPAVLEAVDATQTAMADVDGVRTIDGRAEVSSIISLRDIVAERGEQVRDRLADDLLAWTDPDAAAAQIELPADLDLGALADDLDEADLPADLVAELALRLPEGRSPAAALAATSDPAELDAEVRAAIADDLAASRPDGLTDSTLLALDGVPASALTVTTLRDAGFPLDHLGDDLEALEHLDALEAAGPTSSDDGAVLAGHLDVLADVVPDDVAGVVDDSGLLLVVSSRAGQDGATPLAAGLRTASAPVTEAGGQVTVVSQGLVNAEIIDELAAAQLIAIAISLAAAAVLLVVASLVSDRNAMLGLIGMVPSLVALVLVLGAMRGLGLAFNALTATVASIAVGIGVPYGIHLTNRFRECTRAGRGADEAIRECLTNTGPALVSSGVTTGLAFSVLMLSSSAPLRQFGIVSTMMIMLALLGCLLVQPALLVLWGRRRARRIATARPRTDASRRSRRPRHLGA